MKIQEAYNIWADQYDSNQNKTRDLDRRSTIETLVLFDFSTVIELGCGTGKNTSYLLKRADKVIALDFSEEMVSKAKAKIPDERVEFRIADLTMDWKIRDEFADLVTCNLVLEHISNMGFIFREANRTIKDDGIFFVSELHPFKQYQGSKARFFHNGKTEELQTYVHHISDYLQTAKESGFELIQLKEWFDEAGENEVPRLIGLVFKKRKEQS